MAGEAGTGIKAGVAAGCAAMIAVGWVYASARAPSYLLPPPAVVWEAAVTFFTSSRQLGHLGATLFHIGSSISVAFGVGAALALLAHYAAWSAPAIRDRLTPFLNAFSGIAWTLLSVIWFGVSSTTVIFTITVVLLPFALVNLREGLDALDRETDEMGRSFTRSRLRVFRLLILPALVPFAAATLRIMFGVAWKVALTAELFGGDRGLGFLVNLARQEFATETIFVVIIFIIVSVYLADRLVFMRFERAAARRYGGRTA
ncbi:MAG: ABC transporter permease subunit [Hyphomicrobiales bacterium]|nr:ABC transporter permease subunit [Hyphomicrobiales bacterium]